MSDAIIDATGTFRTLGQEINNELMKAIQDGDRNKFYRVIMAAMGAIPWVGGMIGGAAGAWAEKDQGRTNVLYQRWLEEHQENLRRLGLSLADVITRLDGLDDTIHDRVQSEEYLSIVRKAFRTWNDADTDEKRKLIQNLLAHSGATRICSDDVVRLFIDWIKSYHEIHFKVIKAIYESRGGIGRGAIWDKLHGDRVREDSAEADLYKLLIRDMTIGGIIRQARETTYDGQFVKKKHSSGRRSGSSTMKSAFDNSEPYVLTQLGQQFVHYTMTELVPRIGNNQ